MVNLIRAKITKKGESNLIRLYNFVLIKLLEKSFKFIPIRVNK